MKKLLCTATALLAALSLSTAAFASGGVVKSTANEMNVVTFESGSETQAKLQYMADSDPDNFYAGLSTDWDDCAFADLFDDQNACLYAFEINPSIPSTTVPTIVIYNPFDADGDAAINPKDVVFYRISNGTLEDVSSYFTVGENDSGYDLYCTYPHARHLYSSGKRGRFGICFKALGDGGTEGDSRENRCDRTLSAVAPINKRLCAVRSAGPFVQNAPARKWANTQENSC